ncbi:MAG TPA: ribonuclease P protein component [Candidatus Caenarcaniphilales bacterium]
MLPKLNRLRQHQAFTAVYKGGIRCTTPHLILRALQKPYKFGLYKELQPTQIGISISQKVSKKAVVRNRIKRQIRAACRQLLPQLQPGWSIVIIVRVEACGCDYHKFLQELKQLLMDAEILHGY